MRPFCYCPVPQTLHNDVSIKSISFHPHYDLFISSDIAGQIFIWNSRVGIKIKTISSVNTKSCSSVAYSSDGLHFVEFSDKGQNSLGVNVWSTSMGYHEGLPLLSPLAVINSMPMLRYDML